MLIAAWWKTHLDINQCASFETCLQLRIPTRPPQPLASHDISLVLLSWEHTLVLCGFRPANEIQTAKNHDPNNPLHKVRHTSDRSIREAWRQYHMTSILSPSRIVDPSTYSYEKPSIATVPAVPPAVDRA